MLIVPDTSFSNFHHCPSRCACTYLPPIQTPREPENAGSSIFAVTPDGRARVIVKFFSRLQDTEISPRGVGTLPSTLVSAAGCGWINALLQPGASTRTPST